MKKTIIIFVIGGALLAVYITCRLTHTLDIYKVASASSKPTYDVGNILLGSRLKAPDRNTFICFRRANDRNTWVYRCVAKGGDIIEMRNAVFFLNGKALNEPYTWNEYIITKKQLNAIPEYIEKNEDAVNSINDSTSVISMTSADLKKYHLNLRPVVLTPLTTPDSLCKELRGPQTTADNFGPVKVPQNCYFTLGDNRHNAVDSRYRGFVKSDEIVAVIIGKLF